jgi:hypothetical protein
MAYAWVGVRDRPRISVIVLRMLVFIVIVRP